MKRLILIVLLCIISILAHAQKLKEYKASNGIIYHPGDTVKLGLGSGTNGQFVYMVPNMLNSSSTQLDWIKRRLSRGNVIIKKIKQEETIGMTKTLFYVGAGAAYNLHLDIEAAIESCEVKPCNK
ncbi:hypothetical protein ABIC74_000740 [Mucilaginibacter rubeus]|uniref:hypothetical protein n=1 Tax=Mucilaginibacter rubeus TaxID=2027860 RepID=UPI0033985A7E